jgi:hypothetical protein
MAVVTFPDINGEPLVVDVGSDDPDEIARAVADALKGKVPGTPEINVLLGDKDGKVYVFGGPERIDDVGVADVELTE